MTRAGYHVVEARWEEFGDQDFFEIDVLCGTLDDAKAVALRYLHRHISAHENNLVWVEGIPNKQGYVYYANNQHITFRIRQ